MNIEISARYFTPSEKLKVLVEEKVSKVEKYHVELTRCNVVLTKEENGAEESVEIIAHGKGHEFVSHDNSSKFEKSLASAVNKLSIQIKKYHDKKVSH